MATTRPTGTETVPRVGNLAGGYVDHRHLAAIHGDLLVVGNDRRHDASPDHRVHHPRLQAAPPYAGDRPVVFHAEEDLPAVHVGERHDLLSQLLGVDAVPLELDLGAFPGFEDVLQLGFQYGDGPLFARIPECTRIAWTELQRPVCRSGPAWSQRRPKADRTTTDCAPVTNRARIDWTRLPPCRLVEIGFP